MRLFTPGPLAMGRGWGTKWEGRGQDVFKTPGVLRKVEESDQQGGTLMLGGPPAQLDEGLDPAPCYEGAICLTSHAQGSL